VEDATDADPGPSDRSVDGKGGDRRHGVRVGFPAQYDVAAKTGTAQTGNALKNTDDWLIAFAPATDPTIAIAVVVPYQPTPDFGATVAGPIVKALVDAFFQAQAGRRREQLRRPCTNEKSFESRERRLGAIWSL